jgi:hypothetical protein
MKQTKIIYYEKHSKYVKEKLSPCQFIRLSGDSRQTYRFLLVVNAAVSLKVSVPEACNEWPTECFRLSKKEQTLIALDTFVLLEQLFIV